MEESEMSTQLLIQVKQFLKDLEPLQDAMLNLFDSKRSAVTAACSGEMLRLAEVESELTEKMQEILRTRHRILQQASREGIVGDTIEDLVSFFGGDERDVLQSRIKVARRKSGKIRRESWVPWVVSQRASND